MITARLCETGDDAGKWYSVILEHKGVRRAGYCATGCAGHHSSRAALAHYLQFQLDRETDLWLDRREPARACEILASARSENTTLRATVASLKKQLAKRRA